MSCGKRQFCTPFLYISVFTEFNFLSVCSRIAPSSGLFWISYWSLCLCNSGSNRNSNINSLKRYWKVFGLTMSGYLFDIVKWVETRNFKQPSQTKSVQKISSYFKFHGDFLRSLQRSIQKRSYYAYVSIVCEIVQTEVRPHWVRLWTAWPSHLLWQFPCLLFTSLQTSLAYHDSEGSQSPNILMFRVRSGRRHSWLSRISNHLKLVAIFFFLLSTPKLDYSMGDSCLKYIMWISNFLRLLFFNHVPWKC